MDQWTGPTTTRVSRSLGAILVTVLLSLVLAACSGSGSTPPTSAPPSPTTPPAPAPPPSASSCYQLSYAAATSPTSSAKPVPCTSPHNTMTVYVGKVDLIVDGHLLAVDSQQVQQVLAQRCTRKVSRFLGGDQSARRLSRFQAIWFGPTVEQADLGADWFRCDVVALASQDALAPLGRGLHNILANTASLNRYGICGTSSPSASSFQRVICSEQHSWRAVGVIDLPAGARFLSKSAGATADSACKAIASGRANGALKYTWAFEWPTAQLWQEGQRYGFCWLPGK